MKLIQVSVKNGNNIVWLDFLEVDGKQYRLVDDSECEPKFKDCERCYIEKNYHQCNHEPKTKIEKLEIAREIYGEISNISVIENRNKILELQKKLNLVIDHLFLEI